MSSAVQNLVNGFGTAVNPQLTKSYASEYKKGLHKLMFSSSRISFFLLLLIALPVMIEISYFLHLRRSGAIRIRRKDAIRIRRRAARTSVRPTCLTRPTHASSRPACKSRPHDRTRPVKNTCTQPVQEHLFAQSDLL